MYVLQGYVLQNIYVKFIYIISETLNNFIQKKNTGSLYRIIITGRF